MTIKLFDVIYLFLGTTVFSSDTQFRY